MTTVPYCLFKKLPVLRETLMFVRCFVLALLVHFPKCMFSTCNACSLARLIFGNSVLGGGKGH